MYRKCLEISFIFVLTIQLMAWTSIGCCDKSNNVRSRRDINHLAANKRHRFLKRQLMLAPALLLTTADSISLIYPKEMGYAKDFLHTIYKLKQSDAENKTDTMSHKKHRLRIEDAVYDNRTWSIYFILSNASAAGSQIIRLTHLVPFYKQKIFNQKHLNYLKELDSSQK